jgi:3-hydroxyacyl-CoA dehydrogenase
MSSPLATIGIISIGEMGLGIAKLLVASGYRVTTNVTGRRHVVYNSIVKTSSSGYLTPMQQSRYTQPSQVSLSRFGLDG